MPDEPKKRSSAPWPDVIMPDPPEPDAPAPGAPAPGAPAPDAPESEEEGPKVPGLEFYSTFQTLVVVLSALVMIFTFIGRLISVDGESMVPTLLHGELMAVRSIGYTPKQGDIIVLTQASFRKEAIVKRLIAKGGQTVEIDYEAGTVSVDGVVLDEPYINEPMLPRGDITSIVVPEGCLFVMGDNRNVSADSRYNYVGLVDERRVLGHAVAVILPFQNFTLL